MANHITVLRIKAGISTSKEAAESLKISRSMNYQVEGNLQKGYYRVPGIELGIRMKELYKCSLDDIFLPFFNT